MLGRSKVLSAEMLTLKGHRSLASILRRAIINTKYDKPARAERQSQASRMMAWWMTVGVEWPTRNLEIISRSNSILIMNLLELITNGTSGLSNARVDEDKAASSAEV